MGFFLAGVHAFFSLALLSPAYYSKYFDEVGRLNLQGEIAMSVGVLALFCLLGPAVTTLPMMPKAIGGVRWKRNQRLGYIALLFVVVHLAFLGFNGWLAPGDGHGGIPPISLVAVVAAVVPLLVRSKWERDKQERAATRLDGTGQRESP
jgi:DMSO/TMAO reductase YedYZ heme-binding membrane subunit